MKIVLKLIARDFGKAMALCLSLMLLSTPGYALAPHSAFENNSEEDAVASMASELRISITRANALTERLEAISRLWRESDDGLQKVHRIREQYQPYPGMDLYFDFQEQWGMTAMHIRFPKLYTMVFLLDPRERPWPQLDALGFRLTNPAHVHQAMHGFWIMPNKRRLQELKDLFKEPAHSIMVKSRTRKQRLVAVNAYLCGTHFSRYMDWSRGGHLVAEWGIGYPPYTAMELAEAINNNNRSGKWNRVLALDRQYPTTVFETHNPSVVFPVCRKPHGSVHMLFDGQGRIMGLHDAAEQPGPQRILPPAEISQDALQEALASAAAAAAGKPQEASDKLIPVMQQYGHPAMQIMDGDIFHAPIRPGSLDMIQAFNILVYHGDHFGSAEVLSRCLHDLREGGIALIGDATLLATPGDFAHFTVYRKERDTETSRMRMIPKEFVFVPWGTVNSRDTELDRRIEEAQTRASIHKTVMGYFNPQISKLMGYLRKEGLEVRLVDGLVSVTLEPDGKALRIDPSHATRARNIENHTHSEASL